MKKTISFFILFFMFATFVYSAQPSIVTQASITDTLNIVTPKSPYFEQYSISKLHFHVYNSTGSLITNATTQCSLHMYNSTGNHIISEPKLLWDTKETEYFFTLNNTFTQEKIEIPYIVWCFGTQEKGWVSSEIFINDKSIYTDKSTYLYFALFLIFIICIYLFIAVTWKQEEKTSIIKIFFFLFVIWLIPLISQLMIIIGEVADYSEREMTLLRAIYETTMYVNITFSFIVGIFLLYNVLLLLGVDILKSFKKPKRIGK